MILPGGTVSATCNALLFKIPYNVRNGWDEAATKEWNYTKPNQELADAERKKFLP